MLFTVDSARDPRYRRFVARTEDEPYDIGNEQPSTMVRKGWVIEHIYRDNLSRSGPPMTDEEWFATGDFHRTVSTGGYTTEEVKDIVSPAWVIDLDSLEELKDFIDKTEEDIVIGPCHWSPDTLNIRIYNDYME